MNIACSLHHACQNDPKTFEMRAQIVSRAAIRADFTFAAETGLKYLAYRPVTLINSPKMKNLTFENFYG